MALTIREIIEESWERVGVEPRSGYQFRTALRTLNLLLSEWANRGLNLWTVEQNTEALSAGESSVDIGSDTVDLIDYMIRDSSGTDTSLTRVSVDTYSRIPNKTQTGKPSQIYIDRAVQGPVAYLWPVPSTTYTFVYWRLRQMTEADRTETDISPDIPFRFVPALIAGMAYYLALKTPGMEQRVVMLKAAYDESMNFAMQEDRERSSLMIVPMGY